MSYEHVGKLNEEINELKKQKQLANQSVELMNTVTNNVNCMCERLDDNHVEMTEFDDTSIRQMIDTIKGIDKDSIQIVFKNGVDVRCIIDVA